MDEVSRHLWVFSSSMDKRLKFYTNHLLKHALCYEMMEVNIQILLPEGI